MSVCEISTFRWTFDEDVDRYHELGYESMGIWRYKLHEFGDEKAQEYLASDPCGFHHCTGREDLPEVTVVRFASRCSMPWMRLKRPPRCERMPGGIDRESEWAHP